MSTRGRRRRRNAERMKQPAANVDPEERAREIAMQRLALQPQTREQLARALQRKDIPDEAVNAVLDRLTDVRLIDDEAYAHAWVESRHASRGLAKKALAYELRKRGVEDEIVDDAVDRLDTDTEARTARALVDKKLPSTRQLEAPKRMRKLVGMLARKGYSAPLAFRVVTEALEAEGVEDVAELESLVDSVSIDDADDVAVDVGD